eukprot:gene37181-45127_t
METRLSLPLEVLHRLARRVNLDNYETMPKSVLHQTLQSQYNLSRLLRLDSRDKSAHTESHTSATSTSASSTSSSARKKRRLIDVENDPKAGKRHKPAATPLARSAAPSPAAAHPSTPKKPTLNTLDPIMLCPIYPKRTPFIFTRPNGTKVQFNVDTLVDYLVSTGDFTDPETRIPFQEADLKRIDEL